MMTIRASELGAFLYCRKAWHLSRQGVEPANQAELLAGSEIHQRHGRAVLTSGCLTYLAYGLVLLAVMALTVYATGQFIQ